MWMLPFAYGGPSCSTNLGAPLRRARIFPYRSIARQRASVSGSLVGRLAFIGKSVRGRLTVSFHSGMDILQFYNEDDDSRRYARQWTEGADPGRAHGAARVGVVLVQSRFEGRAAWTDRRLALGRAHEFQGHDQHPARPGQRHHRAVRRKLERLYVDR